VRLGCLGGGQEIVEAVNNQPVKPAKIDWIKWVIWLPWVSLIAWLAFSAGGYSRVSLLHLTETGISVDEPFKYITYYAVVFIFVGLAALVGRRAGCHTICWMAPFMMIGRWVRNRFGWASLRCKDASACSDCKICVKNCPHEPDVNAMVKAEQMEHPNASCAAPGG
jgi:polyferredoxin